MGALNRGEFVEDVSWLSLDDPAAAGTARRALEQLGTRLGLPATRVAEAGLAVTEIATNVHRHAGGGSLLLRSVLSNGVAAIEVVAMDQGPGMTDLLAAGRDGYSTAGSLGIGLGAISRLASRLDIGSTAGRGTVLVARFDTSADRGATTVADPSKPSAEGITRPLGGESVCGDAYAVRHEGARTWLMMSDGSGHGPLAATASGRAVRAFEQADLAVVEPEGVLRSVHQQLQGSRGAAVAVARLDPDRRTIRFCGLGNICGVVAASAPGTPEGTRRMISVGGVAGHRAPAFRSYDYPLPGDAVVVLHSDGLRARWDVDRLRPLHRQRPLVLAAVLLRDAGVHRDDACVLVARETS